MYKVLYLARVASDVERACALALSKPEDFKILVVYAGDFYRVTDRNLRRAISKANLKLIDINDICSIKGLSRSFLGLARKTGVSNYYHIGKTLEKLSFKQISFRLNRFFNLHQFDMLAMTYHCGNVQNAPYQWIYKYFSSRNTPIVYLPHGIPMTSDFGPEDPKNLPASKVYMTNHWELKSNRMITMPGQTVVSGGDPALSQEFIEILTAEDSSPKENFILLPVDNWFAKRRDYLDGLKSVITRFQSEFPRFEICLKLHPNSNISFLLNEFSELKNVEIIWNQRNSFNLLCEASHVLTHPSTVLMEAISLNKKCVVLDFWESYELERMYPLLGVPMIPLSRLHELDLEDFKESYHHEIMREFAWGGRESSEMLDFYWSDFKALIQG